MIDKSEGLVFVTPFRRRKRFCGYNTSDVYTGKSVDNITSACKLICKTSLQLLSSPNMIKSQSCSEINILYMDAG